ncbi:hypothetical protein [Falsiroseomonas selenitidurans]|uniref:PepSY domain-containing protein n=1 Tax=Falsiroseomonas selenitidurans TaxID=2716335 RepID=A0ABX1DYP7_9PROT|nr:hypothetical protein [Falsiroseomonas selenitidurans]NKC29996.1 hypothetical protein [Falsiroseomonas selenitidurans]
MPIRHKAIAGAALAASLGLAGAALAQSTSPSATLPNLDATGRPVTGQAERRPGAPAQQTVNPTPMAPGSQANQAPGMGGGAVRSADPASGQAGPIGGQAAGERATQSANPTNMPPGSRAGQAPGMGWGQAGNAAAAGENPTNMPPGTRAAQAPGMGGGAPTRRAAPADPASPQGGPAAQMPAERTPSQAAGPLPGSRNPIVDPARPPTTAADIPGLQGNRNAPFTHQGMGASGAQTPATGPAVGREPSRPEPTIGATTPGLPAEGGGTAPALAPTDNAYVPPSTVSPDTPPLPGANSFTEGQAAARIADAGFIDVQALRLDEQGVWRGRAMRNGRLTGVALDFRGNVVATAP